VLTPKDKLTVVEEAFSGGLIRADFLTPRYDITYSPSAENYKRRRRKDRYHDFCMLPQQLDDDILFFGGKDYLPLFRSLTNTRQEDSLLQFCESAEAQWLHIQTLRNVNPDELALRMCQKLPQAIRRRSPLTGLLRPGSLSRYVRNYTLRKSCTARGAQSRVFNAVTRWAQQLEIRNVCVSQTLFQGTLVVSDKRLL
jgi:hypothetical protein